MLRFRKSRMLLKGCRKLCFLVYTTRLSVSGRPRTLSAVVYYTTALNRLKSLQGSCLRLCGCALPWSLGRGRPRMVGDLGPPGRREAWVGDVPEWWAACPPDVEKPGSGTSPNGCGLGRSPSRGLTPGRPGRRDRSRVKLWSKVEQVERDKLAIGPSPSPSPTSSS